jgi:colicin import membrane protein
MSVSRIVKLRVVAGGIAEILHDRGLARPAGSGYPSAMAWEEQLDPDWLDEAPFFVAAAFAYGVLFISDPTIRWGSAERAPDRAVPIEFVAKLPVPSPNLAPALGGGDDRTPRRGPGEYVPEKIRAGAPEAPPKPHPNPKPAAPPAPRAKAPPRPAGRPAPHPAAHPRKAVAKPPPDPAVLAAREEARIEAAREAQAEKEEAARERAEKQAAADERRRQRAAAKAAAAEAARVEAAKRAAARAAALEAARVAAAERAAAAKAAAERRAEAARERARQIAAAKAEAARKKAELSQTLATAADPDEALDADADSGGGAPARAAAAAAPLKTAPGATGSGGADGGGAAGARRTAAAAALADTAEPADAGDAAGNGGADLLDASAKGGGVGPDGSGVSWTMDGPVGNRRVLKRAAPTSPDWVGARGLDLTVTVRFQVLPDGTVKPGSVIQKTSGFPEIDQRALDALSGWRFEAADGAPETWGRVTFRFTSA